MLALGLPPLLSLGVSGEVEMRFQELYTIKIQRR